MCGICGIVGFGEVPEVHQIRARVDAMLDALRHRGPNATGARGADDAVLGATRLAVRGIAAPDQPSVDAPTGVIVVCNGEIDNHKELRRWLEGRGRSVPAGSDVEVLPGLYLELGDAFVERLAGAFALAVWDPRSRRLLLARDRAGSAHCSSPPCPGSSVLQAKSPPFANPEACHLNSAGRGFVVTCSSETSPRPGRRLPTSRRWHRANGS